MSRLFPDGDGDPTNLTAQFYSIRLRKKIDNNCMGKFVGNYICIGSQICWHFSSQHPHAVKNSHTSPNKNKGATDSEVLQHARARTYMDG